MMARRMSNINKKFDCGICGQGFTRKDNLAVHVRRHSLIPVLECEECGRSFAYKHVLQEHIKFMHSKNVRKDFKCENCSYATKRKRDLDRHLLACKNGQVYPCDKCGSVFSHPSNLRRHEATVHSNVEYPCPDCGKVLYTLGKLMSHQEKLHGELPLSCSVCKKKYSTLRELAVHLTRTHVPKVGINCPFCEHVVASKRKETLERHIRGNHS